MVVLVTGGAGYIGSHMVWHLKDRGADVVVLDNLTTGYDWLLPGDVELVVGDLFDNDCIARLFAAHDIDAVIHFAGSIIVPESVANPLKYYTNNTIASLNLIAACVRRNIRKFVFSSTAAVYGDPASCPVPESAPLVPLSPYGSSKLMTEQMLRDTAAAHDFRYCALRYFNVAGADPQARTGQATANATHLIKLCCEAAMGRRDRVTVFGTDYDTPDGTGVRDYIHVSDLVGAHALALDYLTAGGTSTVMNCGYGQGFSVLEVIDCVKSVSGVDFPVDHAERRPGDSPMVVAASERVRETLAWQPEYNDLETIVSHALAWEEKLRKRNRV